MSKTFLAILIGALLVSGALYITNPKEGLQANNDNWLVEEEEKDELNEEEKNEDTEEEKNEPTEEVEKEGKGLTELVDCLAEEGVVIYGSRTCPACAQLAESFGGYEEIESIYVECTEDYDRCGKEKTTGWVPEIQIKGELYEGGRSPASLAEEAGCDF